MNGTASDSTGLTYTSSQLQNGDALTCTLTPGTGACSATTTTSNAIQAVVYPLPSVTISPADTAVSIGAQVTLHSLTSSDVTTWQWQPSGSTDPDLTVTADSKQQTYNLTVRTANNCSTTTTATITVYQVLNMPSGFTPNGDGHNDVFRIPPGVQMNLTAFSIYDRWGTKVFSTQNQSEGWDGTLSGHPAPTGAYVYIVTGTNPNGPINIKGTVMLIR